MADDKDVKIDKKKKDEQAADYGKLPEGELDYMEQEK